MPFKAISFRFKAFCAVSSVLNYCFFTNYENHFTQNMLF